MSLFGKCNPCCKDTTKPEAGESQPFQIGGFCWHIDGRPGCYNQDTFQPLYIPQTQFIDPFDGAWDALPYVPKSLWQPYGGIAASTGSVPGDAHHREYCRIYDRFEPVDSERTLWDKAVEILGAEPDEIHFRGTAIWRWKISVDFGFGSDGRCSGIGIHWPDYEPPLLDGKPYIPFRGGRDVTMNFSASVGVGEFDTEEDAARAALSGNGFSDEWLEGGELTLKKDAADSWCGGGSPGTVETNGDAAIDFDVTEKFKSLRLRDSPLHIAAKVYPVFSALGPVVFGWKYCPVAGLVGNGPFGHGWHVRVAVHSPGFVGITL